MRKYMYGRTKSWHDPLLDSRRFCSERKLFVQARRKSHHVLTEPESEKLETWACQERLKKIWIASDLYQQARKKI